MLALPGLPRHAVPQPAQPELVLVHFVDTTAPSGASLSLVLFDLVTLELIWLDRQPQRTGLQRVLDLVPTILHHPACRHQCGLSDLPA